ncbi:MAG: hypothetical protein DRQ89_11935 [Epsilonproteobacteria bacterium]|nr:MAG: hypothetical protein DRQ89_11935 [Campylobacterota bacterium]
MKGTFFQRPLELTLNINGESWKQGDTINGNLSVKNHGTESVSLKDFGVILSFGAVKKIKIKDPKAFTFLGEQIFKVSEITGGSEIELPFSFSLAEDAPISEKSAAFYILCGYKEKPFENGMLEVHVLPCEIITNLFQVFENLLRFKVKALKNKKDCIEATITVPTGKEYSSVQQLKVLVKMTGDKLNIDFNFKLKKISFENGVMSTKDETLQVKRLLTPKEYLIYGDAFNQDKVFKLLQEVIEDVKVRPLI